VSGLEIALNFKNHGNELHAQRSYRDAIEAYTSGLTSGPTSSDLRVSLLNNRAACNLALRNYGAVLKDTGVIIALTSTEVGQAPTKAMYRAAQSLVALGKWQEAKDCVERGQGLAKQQMDVAEAWGVLEEQVERGTRKEVEGKERLRREKLGAEALRRAIEVNDLLFSAFVDIDKWDKVSGSCDHQLIKSTR